MCGTVSEAAGVWNAQASAVSQGFHPFAHMHTHTHSRGEKFGTAKETG